MSEDGESAEVRELKAQIAEMLLDGSDWGRHHLAWLRSQIRQQRMAEARAKGTHTKEQWQAILKKYDHRCVRCGAKEDHAFIEKDHIVPVYQGGSDGPDNLQPMCSRCNASKGPDSSNWRVYRDYCGFDE